MERKQKPRVPIADNMWQETGDGIVLTGSTCEDCGEVFFPQKEIAVCSHCQGTRLRPAPLSREGTIHSYTVVHQAPAGGFYRGEVPFVYAVVALPEGVYIQTHLTGADPDAIRLGDRVEAVLDVLYEDDEKVVTTYKFRPPAGEGGAS